MPVQGKHPIYIQESRTRTQKLHGRSLAALLDDAVAAEGQQLKLWCA
jgi:hypothetical protein